MLGELLIDEVARKRLDGLEGEVDGVGDHPVLCEAHLELEGDLGPSAPTLRDFAAARSLLLELLPQVAKARLISPATASILIAAVAKAVPSASSFSRPNRRSRRDAKDA